MSGITITKPATTKGNTNEERREEVEKFFVDKNELKGKRKEELSPSGRFKLDIRYYKTRAGAWDYSRGIVKRMSDGAEICDIKRNYSTFHHSFVTKADQEWLITGRSYMSQTIVNLDTGEEFEPKGTHFDGYGFCWAQHYLSPDGNTLVVNGCHWACPYEFKFFDFSDPSKGWPELPLVKREEFEKYKDNLEDAEHTYIYQDEEEPKFNDDGTITAYETTSVFIPNGKREDDISEEECDAIGDEAYDDEFNWRREVEVIYTLRRVGDVLVIEDVWQSIWKQEQTRKREEWEAQDKAQKLEWMSTDPIYIALEKLLQNDPDLEFGDLWWCGSSVKARKEGEKNTWFFYPYIRSKHEKKSAQLRWGTVEGPIDVELRHGRRAQTFDRSEIGLKQAIEAIREGLR